MLPFNDAVKAVCLPPAQQIFWGLHAVLNNRFVIFNAAYFKFVRRFKFQAQDCFALFFGHGGDYFFGRLFKIAVIERAFFYLNQVNLPGLRFIVFIIKMPFKTAFVGFCQIGKSAFLYAFVTAKLGYNRKAPANVQTVGVNMKINVAVLGQNTDSERTDRIDRCSGFLPNLNKVQ